MPNDRLSSTPLGAWRLLVRLARFARRTLERCLHIQAASGILLLAAAAVAIVWVNSPWAESCFRLWQVPMGMRLGAFTFERSLAWIVNDGLMAIFFLVVSSLTKARPGLQVQP